MFRKLASHSIIVVVGAIIAFCHRAVSVAQDRAEVRDVVPIRSSITLYGGEPLEVWQTRLGELKPTSEFAAELAPRLIEIVADRQAPDVLREQSALMLGRIGKPAVAAVPVLGGILADPNEPLSNRLWAGRALGYFGKYASPAANALIDFLFDEQIPVQYRGVPVEALGLMGGGHPNVLPALLRLFQYTRDEHGNLSSSEITHFRELAAEAFTMMGQDAAVAAPLLMRAARNPSEVESIRRKSVVALGLIGANAAVAIPVLIESLEFDPSEALRDEAARALAKIGEPAFAVMERYLAHPDPSVRWRIAAALGELKSPPPSMVVALQRAITDPDELVRITAAESLGKLAAGRDELLPVAIQLLASDDRQIRMRSMRLIIAHRPLRPSEVTALETLRSHGQPETVRIAHHVLKKLKEAANDELIRGEP